MQQQYFNNRTQCPACNSTDIPCIYELSFTQSPIREYLRSFYTPQGGIEFEYLENADFCLCECKSCGLIFQKEIPGPLLMHRLYEKWIDPVKECRNRRENYDPNRLARYAREISTIVAYFGGRPSELRILDFGMGCGEWSLTARRMGCDVYGTELSESKKETAAALGIKVIEWDDIPNTGFDFINTEQVFEHLPEPLQTLAHLKTALSDIGITKISVPNAHNIERRLKRMDWEAPRNSRNSLNPVAPLEHINCFKRKSLIHMAQQADMEEVVIPLKFQYKSVTHWQGIKGTAKNLIKPIYRNLLKRENYIFLRNKTEQG